MATIKRITPPIGAMGVFTVRTPYRVKANKSYEVIAIREFRDLWAEHVNIQHLYYESVGLGETEYKRDADLGAAIITLKGDEGMVYVPDTYIESYPVLGLADYHHVVLSVSLGPIAKNKNLQGLQNEINQVVSKFLGVPGKTMIHVAPTSDVITQTQAKKLEQVRKGHIDVPVSDHLKLRQEQNLRQHTLAALNQEITKRNSRP